MKKLVKEPLIIEQWSIPCSELPLCPQGIGQALIKEISGSLNGITLPQIKRNTVESFWEELRNVSRYIQFNLDCILDMTETTDGNYLFTLRDPNTCKYVFK
jgi:hypothetical protein